METAQDFRILRSVVEGMDDEQLFWAVIEPIWPDAGVGLENELSRIVKGTPGQRAIYATALFSREVENGGLAQYFQNSSGMYSRYVQEGLRILGADEMFNTFAKAVNAFPEGVVPIDWEARRRALQGITARDSRLLRDLDEELFQGSGLEERLHPYFRKYIDSHPTEFFKD